MLPLTSTPTYRGRFAPSPTGPLHFGSLVAALGSCLEARSHGGEWLLRIEDVDEPRCPRTTADGILRTLESCGFAWDGEVLWQSRRKERYRELLEQLKVMDRVYPCACTRRELADSQLAPDGAHVYPGTCRDGLPSGRPARAWRLRVDDASAGPPQGSMRPPVGGSEPGSRARGANDLTIAFDDALQGRVEQRLASDVGDFVLLRADGYFAYQLAVVADDADQGITHVVRGADLLDSTARQIFLQRCLGVPTPAYAHLPVVVNASGEKLSKQTLAPAIDAVAPAPSLCAALRFLGQSPPVELERAPVAELWTWAQVHWDMARVPRRRTLPYLP